MVTKARVTAISDNKHEVVIQIPRYTSIDDVPGLTEDQVDKLKGESLTARICTPYGCSANFVVGDTVIVCIEDVSLSNPVVMGKFIPNDNSVGTANATFDTLTVNTQATLPVNTKIGDVTKDNIEQLFGANYNIQGQLDVNLSQKITLLEELTTLLNNTSF